MDAKLLRQLLLCLNKNAFSKFVFELWNLNTYSNNEGFQNVEALDDNFYEQHFALFSASGHVYDYQGYNLIIPFFMLLELLVNTQNFSLNEPLIVNNLIKYKKKIDERESSWQFWTDGQYIMPNVAFVTNFAGINEDVYVDSNI